MLSMLHVRAELSLPATDTVVPFVDAAPEYAEIGRQAVKEASMTRFLSRMFTLAAAAVVLTACASTSDQAAFSAPVPPPAMTEYRVQPGDTLTVKFYYHADHDTDVVVRPDGSVQLPLVGDVPAGGITPQKIAQDLERRYSKNLRDPKIAVTVKAMNQTRVYVGGEVNKPGFVTYREGLTAVQALLEAGGPKDTAKTEEVVFLQKVGDDKFRPAKLNLSKVLDEGDMSADQALSPSDVIFVPKTGIAKLNQFVEQYILKVIPIRPSASMLLF
jgi:protein involved in polysaccharide export with SLBB domain